MDSTPADLAAALASFPSEDNLWTFANEGKLDKVKDLVDSGKHTVNDPDDNGYTPLHAAASYCRVELAEYLLEAGAAHSPLDPDGDSPLHVCESPEIGKLLVGAGADPKSPNAEGKSAVKIAVEEGRQSMAVVYVQLGCITVDELQAEMAGWLHEQARAQLGSSWVDDTANADTAANGDADAAETETETEAQRRALVEAAVRKALAERESDGSTVAE